MGGILVGVLAAVRFAHQIQDLIIVVLPVCPVQAQCRRCFWVFASKNQEIGITGLTSGAGPVGASLLAMVVNDNATILTERGDLWFFASKLAPTGLGAKKSPAKRRGEFHNTEAARS